MGSIQSLLFLLLRLWFFLARLNFGNFREFSINGLPEIVEWWCPQNDAPESPETRNGEQPQKQAVQNHGDELPVLDYLGEKK